MKELSAREYDGLTRPWDAGVLDGVTFFSLLERGLLSRAHECPPGCSLSEGHTHTRKTELGQLAERIYRHIHSSPWP